MWQPHGNRVLDTRFIRAIFNEIKHQQFKPPENTNTSNLLRIFWSTREPTTRSSQTTPLPDHRTTMRDPGRKATQVWARPRPMRDWGLCETQVWAWSRSVETQVRARPRPQRDPLWSKANPPTLVSFFSLFLFLIFFFLWVLPLL